MAVTPNTTSRAAAPSTTPRAMRPVEIYDLFGLALLALLAPLLLLLPGWMAWLRVPLGLGMVLLAPGYALQAALFPRREDADAPIRAALSFGLSIAVIPLLALLLDRLPWGIRPWPIVVSLSIFTLLAAMVGLVRRARLLASGAGTFTPAVPQPRAWWRTLPARARLAYAGATLGLLALFGAAFVALATPDPSGFVTEFYVLGRGGLAEDYPRAARVGEPLTVTAGITNRERTARSYRVTVEAVDPWTNTRTLVATAGPITLEPGATHEWPLTWQMPAAGDDQQVEILLFVDDQPEVYRQLRLWLNVGAR